MIELAYGFDREVAEWVAAHMTDPGYELGFGNCKAIGVVEDGRLIGGTVFHNYEPNAGVIEMSSASISPRWLPAKMIQAIFDYAFETAGCQLVVLRVSERNERMVRIAKRFGFTGHLIPRLGGRDKGTWVFTFTDDDWRVSRYRRD